MKRRMAVVRAAASIGVAFMALGVNAAWAEVKPSVILKSKSGQSITSAINTVQSRYGVTLTLVRTLVTGGQVFQANRSMTPTELQNLITDLRNSSAMAYAQKNEVLTRQFTPNDTRFNEQWNLIDANVGINLTRAWDISTGAGVKIAVLDSGYRPNADLTANIIGGYDFISDTLISNDGDGRDSNAQDPGDANVAGECGPGSPATNSTWHGTHVMGTIGAAANNGIGVAGVAYGAKMIPVRVLGKCGALLSDVAEAAIWAAGGSISGVPNNPNPAKIINMSMAAPGACDPTSQYVIDTLRSLGAVVVAATGNGNVDAANFVPGSCKGVITVAATNRAGGRAYYSNFGQMVAVSAPGGDTRSTSANGILSTMNFGTTVPGTDGYGFEDGTSMAAAQVSGVVALMRAKAPNLTADQTASLLRSTARPFPQTCDQCGEGIVDAFAAVDATVNLPRGVAFLQGGVYEPKLAGAAPTFVADQLGSISEYKLTRRNGNVTQEFRQTTPVFNNLPVMGCSGEDMYWTLTTTDALGRTDTWVQRTVFFFNPGGASIPCGR